MGLDRQAGVERPLKAALTPRQSATLLGGRVAALGTAPLMAPCARNGMVVDNLDPFKEREGESEDHPDSMEGLPKPQGPGSERDPFRSYGVNVILAHDGDGESPVIF